MAKVLLTTIVKPWGRTSERVFQAVRELVNACNTPPPFEDVVPEPNMSVINTAVQGILDTESARSRKGMMCASYFRIEKHDQQGRIDVFHCRNTNSDRIFFIIQKL